MFKLAAITLSLIALSFAATNVPAIRFVNALEDVTVVIYTNTFKTFTLDYMEVSDYQSVSGGSIQVTNVVDNATQVSLTGGIPELVNFSTNATLAIYKLNGTVYLIIFNETAPAVIDNTKAWVRMIDLGQAMEYITLASTGGSIASYVLPLVNTAYSNVDPTTSSVRIYHSINGTYNAPDIVFNTTLNATDAYTVFYFTSTSETNGTNGTTVMTTTPSAHLVFDRSFAGWSNAVATSGFMTSGAKATSGVHMTSGQGVKATSGVAMTSGVKLTSTSAASTSASTSSTTGSTSVNVGPTASSAIKVVVGITALVSLIAAL